MKRLYLIIAGLHSLLVCFGQMQADDSIKVLLNQKIAYETQSELPINDYLETSTQLVSAYISLGMFTEAERVVKSMPKWNAGKVNGKYARVRERIAVHFSR